jgi:hypothetical protein
MLTTISELDELSREEAAYANDVMASRSRQQLRALYFALEQDGLVDYQSTDVVLVWDDVDP